VSQVPLIDRRAEIAKSLGLTKLLPQLA
jgi:hypothetical protein